MYCIALFALVAVNYVCTAPLSDDNFTIPLSNLTSSKNGPKGMRMTQSDVEERGFNDDFESNLYKNYKYIRKPTVFTYDKNGNMYLSGRMLNNDSSGYEVRTVVRKEAEIGYVFCTAGEKNNANCDSSSLILCYEVYDRQTLKEYRKEKNFDDPKYKVIENRCGLDNGISVTTEGRYWRLDTAWGNKYVFPLGIEECFVLWLSIDLDPNVEDYPDFLVEPLQTVELAKANSSDTNHYNYIPEWTMIVEDAYSGRYVQMEWREVALKVSMRDEKTKELSLFATATFKAIGGGPCCQLSAKLIGESVSKCYFWWNMVRECTSGGQDRDDPRICDYTYTVDSMVKTGFETSQASSSSNNSVEAENIRLALGQVEITDISNELAREIVTEVVDEIEKEQGVQRKTDWGVKGEASLNIKSVVSISASSFLNKSDWKDEKKKQAIKNSAAEKVNKKLLEKLTKTVKTELDTGYSNQYSTKMEFTTTQKIMGETVTKTSQTYNQSLRANYPFGMELRQLVHKCMGVETRTELTAEFTDDTYEIERSRKEALRLGYPPEEAYLNCPAPPPETPIIPITTTVPSSAVPSSTVKPMIAPMLKRALSSIDEPLNNPKPQSTMKDIDTTSMDANSYTSVSQETFKPTTVSQPTTILETMQPTISH